MEEYLRESLQPSDFGSYLVVDPARAQNMVQQINRHLEDMAAQEGISPYSVLPYCESILESSWISSFLGLW